MKKTLPPHLEKSRFNIENKLEPRRGELFGAFVIQTADGSVLRVLSSGPARGRGNPTAWEHVSVSCEKRTPTWEEMCFVKDLFWEPEEAVVQFHPPKSKHVNIHQFCLHMWRNEGTNDLLPPQEMV